MTRVRDVMTAQVVAVSRLTPYQEVARLLVSHRISGLPVVMADHRVAGVISETDLLASRDKAAWRAHAATATGRRWHGMRRRSVAVAGELMTAPAVTIGPDATVADAARVMSAHTIGRLPVVSRSGTLIGIISQGDLLSAFADQDGSSPGQEPTATSDSR